MDMSKILQQAKAMEQKMREMQDNLAAMEITGTAGGGLISVTLNGEGTMQAIAIDPSLLKPEEKDILEDLIKAAHNDAKRRKDERAAEESQKMLGGFGGLPGGIKLPF